MTNVPRPRSPSPRRSPAAIPWQPRWPPAKRLRRQMVAAAGARAALPVAAAVAAIAWFAHRDDRDRRHVPARAAGQSPLDPEAASGARGSGAGSTSARSDTTARRSITRPASCCDHDYVRYVARTSTAPDRWDSLSRFVPAPSSSGTAPARKLLVPWGTLNSVGAVNPPMTIDGMALIVVDSAGRLAELTAVPSPTESRSAERRRSPGTRCSMPPDSRSRTSARSTPDLVPTAFADERRAWEGPLPDRPDLTVRVEAAMRSGRPVSFGITGPWTRSRREIVPPPSLFNRVIGGIATIMMPALMILAAVLARSNVKAKRGDHQGAFRIGAFAFVLSLLSWMLEHIARRDPLGRSSAHLRGDWQRALRCRLDVGDLPRARTLHSPLRS